LQSAWQSIVDSWAKAFPGQQLAMMQVPGGFPTIDNNGQIYSNKWGADVQLSTTLMNYGITAYGSRFAIQNNALCDLWTPTVVINEAGQLTTGCQALWWVTGDNSYKMNGGKPIGIATELQTPLNAALAAHVKYLELYPVDLENPVLQPVIAAAHAGLVQNRAPTAAITGLPASGQSPEGTPIVLSANSAADPSSTNPANFTYAWTVTKNGNVYASGSGTNFTFTPNDDGIYVVSLKTTDQAGRTGVATQSIQVTNVAPTVTLTGPSSGNVEQDLTFQANVSDPSSVNMAAGFHYYWHFGDGSGSTGRTVTHAYEARGTYTITVAVWDVDGVGTTITKTITVG
jgi:hypothetical protein